MIHRGADALGRAVGRYGRRVLRSDRIRTVFDTPIPSRPCVWVGWHEANLVTLVLHREVVGRPAAALIPGGLRGAVMTAWLRTLGVTAIPLPHEHNPRHALRRMAEALGRGCDVMIALDGPRGPRRQAKAGALWLATATGAPVAPVGIDVGPAFALPRWDRLIVPLPGACVSAVFGEPLFPRGGRQSQGDLSRLGRLLDALTIRAVDARRNGHDVRIQEAA